MLSVSDKLISQYKWEKICYKYYLLMISWFGAVSEHNAVDLKGSDKYRKMFAEDSAKPIMEG